MPFTIALRRDSAFELANKNPVLWLGEPAYESDTGKFKIGDGVSKWNELPYFLDETKILDLVQAWVDNGDTALNTHIDATTPHPAYDDMPDLTILYDNRKV